MTIICYASYNANFSHKDDKQMNNSDHIYYVVMPVTDHVSNVVVGFQFWLMDDHLEWSSHIMTIHFWSWQSEWERHEMLSEYVSKYDARIYGNF